MRDRSGIISSLVTFLLFVILEAVSIVMITNNGVIQRYRIMNSLREVQAYFWSRNVKFSQFLSYKTENERLWDENIKLKQQLENCRTLKNLLDSNVFEVSPDFTYIQARIVKNYTDNQQNFLVIDRGSDDGVEKGMGVVTEKGVVGIVNASGPHYSQVISFLNVDQSISAKIRKSGEFGPMVWQGTSIKTAVIREIPIHSEVAPGDTIVSSGYSSIYPSDIPIGTVDHTEEVNGISRNIYVTLFENFRALSRVYVVRNNRTEEINSLTGNER